MIWRLFEKQTWRENVITFSCTWISRQCPFKIKKRHLKGGQEAAGREVKDEEGSFMLKPVTFRQSDSFWEQLLQMPFNWDRRKQERAVGSAGKNMIHSPTTPLPANPASLEKESGPGTELRSLALRWLQASCSFHCSHHEARIQPWQSPGALCAEKAKLWSPLLLCGPVDQERWNHVAAFSRASQEKCGHWWLKSGCECLEQATPGFLELIIWGRERRKEKRGLNQPRVESALPLTMWP